MHAFEYADIVDYTYMCITCDIHGIYLSTESVKCIKYDTWIKLGVSKKLKTHVTCVLPKDCSL